MALGKPAIGELRALDLRTVQIVINQIRERLRAAEAQLETTTAQAGQTTFTSGQSNASIAALQAQLIALQNQLAALAASISVDGASGLVANRVFAPHIPLTAPALPQEGATILAGQIFGN